MLRTVHGARRQSRASGSATASAGRRRTSSQRTASGRKNSIAGRTSAAAPASAPRAGRATRRQVLNGRRLAVATDRRRAAARARSPSAMAQYSVSLSAYAGHGDERRIRRRRDPPPTHRRAARRHSKRQEADEPDVAAPTSDCATLTRAGAFGRAPDARRRAPRETTGTPALGRTAAPCRSRSVVVDETQTRREAAREREVLLLVMRQRLLDPVEQSEREPQRECGGRGRDGSGGARACRPESSRLLAALEPHRRNLLGDEADEEHDDGEQDEQHRRVGHVARASRRSSRGTAAPTHERRRARWAGRRAAG